MKTETSLIRNTKITMPNGKQLRMLIALIAVLLVFLTAWGVHTYIATRNLRAAHQALVEGLEEFEKNMTAKAGEQKWGDVARTFDAAHKLYGSTVLGSSFLAYQSRALVYENKLDEAIKVMGRAVDSLKKSSPLFYTYSTKYALMKTDSTDQKIHAEGEKELESLAKDPLNQQRDYALYYAGLRALNDNDGKKAQLLWSQISQVNPASVWLPLVEKKRESSGL